MVGKTETVKNVFSPHWNTAVTLDVADKTKVGHGRRHWVMSRKEVEAVACSPPSPGLGRYGGEASRG